LQEIKEIPRVGNRTAHEAVGLHH